MKTLIFVILTIFLLTGLTIAQSPVYPIIFIHGLNSSDETWEEALEFFTDLGWQYSDLSTIGTIENDGVFHAVLNKDFNSTKYTDDVVVYDKIGNYDLFCINFNGYYDKPNNKIIPYHNHGVSGQSESNESSVAKQAYALGLMIKKVLETTGAEKVVLFGHSMGGLAVREYLQRTDSNGNPQWWVDKNDKINGHKVAKLVTFGTPHLGSNASDWGAIVINPNSEAARDLHYNYSDSYIYGRGYDDGVFLFGGNEQYDEMRDDNFHNYDINCDGDEDDQNIKGLNSTLGDWFANPGMSLPTNTDYSWIASDNGVGGDEAVKLERQYIKSHGDIIYADRNHLTETKDEYSIVRGLDEPDTKELAYNIKLGEKYHLFSTYQSGNSRLDVDWLHFSINQSNIIKFSIEDIPVNHITNMSVRLYEKESNTRLENIEWDKQQNSIVFYRQDLDKSDYFLQIVTELPEGGSDSYKHPFVVKVEYIGHVSKLFSYATPLSMKADNVSKSTIHTEIQDPYGNLVGTATNEITYSIIEGQSHGLLIGDSPVKAHGGIATIQLQATSIPGQIKIACSSSGLVSDTITVYTYGEGFSTQVGGHISTNTTWTIANSPYEVTKDLTVDEGVVLKIEPGVIVKLRKDVDIFVKGGMNAVGTEYNKVIFTSNGDQIAGFWGGVDFKGSTLDDRSALKYCEFYYGGSSSYGESGYPIVLDLRANPSISHTSIKDSRRNAIGIRSGSYTVDVHLNNPGLPLWLNSDLTIEKGATLTIDPGVLIKLYKDVDVFIKGGFNARGTASDPIIFTSYKDDARGGDSNNDGSSLPLAGTWGGLDFKGSTLDDRSALKYCEFYYGGSSSYGESGYPIVLDLRANPSISHTSIKDSRRNAIGIRSGSYTVDVHLNNPGLPLWLNSDLTIEKGATLTIDPGVLIKIYKEVDIFIKGALKANGTKQAPIVFTSYKDDARGGDSNNDGSSLPLSGTWGGVNFKQSSWDKGSTLRYCELYFGGNNSYGESAYPLVINGSNPLIENTKLSFSRSHGIYIQNEAEPDLGGGKAGSAGENRFLGFIAENKYAIYNNTSVDIYAKNNFWDTNEIQEIESQIYDKNDNPEKGIVYFQPYKRKNTAPSSFHLLIPENHDTLTTFDIFFGWEDANDLEKDVLYYDLFIQNNDQDTLIEKIENTSFNFVNNGFLKENRKYIWSVNVWDGEYSTSAVDTFSFATGTATQIVDNLDQKPVKYNLFQNYPNPFNPSTIITYQLKRPSWVLLSVYDLRGREVTRLVDAYKPMGEHKVRFNAGNLAGGVYIYRIRAGNYEQSKKLLFLR